jgi:hypothetical protein
MTPNMSLGASCGIGGHIRRKTEMKTPLWRIIKQKFEIVKGFGCVVQNELKGHFRAFSRN